MLAESVPTYVSLRSDARFQQVYRQGEQKRAGGISIIQLENEARTPEVGFVVGKRVGGAVVRNRAKRRLREATRRVDLSPHTTYIVIADRPVVTAEFGRLVSWVEQGTKAGTHLSDESIT